MRGGTNQEGLFLEDCPELDIKRTDMPDMDQLVARHKARYHLAAFLARPGMMVLDFPCGSGYGYEILGSHLHKGVAYVGMDNDVATIKYAELHYPGVPFGVRDMTKPRISGQYDLILCIEGLEHIECKYQKPLIETFYNALKPGGRLLVSMPEAPGQSGPSKTNPYHIWELDFMDFQGMLWYSFDNGVQIITIEDTLHNGIKSTLLYGICQKEGKE